MFDCDGLIGGRARQRLDLSVGPGELDGFDRRGGAEAVPESLIAEHQVGRAVRLPNQARIMRVILVLRVLKVPMVLRVLVLKVQRVLVLKVPMVLKVLVLRC